jgi:hypothetical protein
VHVDKHMVFAVGLLKDGCPLVEPGGVIGELGTRQFVWQIAAVELQVIMQFVTAPETID